jgi:uncharacterized cupredoxin-like copper-binding protein
VRWLAALVIPAAALAGAVCVRHATAAPARVTAVHVTERDFHISAPKQVSNGSLLLTVTNKGPDNHELIIVRTPSARLQLRSDGLTVNEEALRRVKQKSLEPGAPGSVRELRLHLPPGRYVFFCNMSGHFLAGMHAALVVR